MQPARFTSGFSNEAGFPLPMFYITCGICTVENNQVYKFQGNKL